MTTSLPSPDGKSIRHQPLVWLILTALTALVFWLRVAPGWDFFSADSSTVLFPETDPYYHFRQASYTLEHYPTLMRWDGASHYPAVLRNDAVGLFTLTLASLAKIVSGVSTLPPHVALYWVCLLVPPLAAAILVPLVYLLVRKQATAGIATTMALWYVLLPGDGLPRTSMGFCDHHVAEMLLSLLCIYGLLRVADNSREPLNHPWWRPSWVAASPLVLFFFTWVGTPLYLPILAIAFAIQLVADVLAGRDARLIGYAAARYWLAFLLMTGAIGLLVPDLVMHRGLWQGSCLGAGILVALFACLGVFLKPSPVANRPRKRLLWASVLGTLLLMGLLFSVPSLLSVLRETLSPKSLHVGEHIPVSTPYYLALTGLAGILALLTPAVGLMTGAWRKPSWWLGVVPSLLIIALWCRTYDYAYLGALHAVVLSGVFWGACCGTWKVHWVSTALAVATLAILGGVWLGLTHPLRLTTSSYEGPIQLNTPGWQEATAWLAQHPRSDTPRAGVLTDWPHGNLINTLTPHPTISSRYPEAEGLVPLFEESEASVRAAPLRGSTVADSVRYIVLSPTSLAENFPPYAEEAGLDPNAFVDQERIPLPRGGHHKRPIMNERYERLFAHRLLLDNGNGLSHFRLVFESDEPMLYRLVNDPSHDLFGPETDRLKTPERLYQAQAALRQGTWREGDKEAYRGRILPTVSLFEQVKGARIHGMAQPNGLITAELDLKVVKQNSTRDFTHRIRAQANSDGHFELILPYSTDISENTQVLPQGLWSISYNKHEQTTAVAEKEVVEGRTINIHSGTTTDSDK